ncbi:hypothetical protein D3C75_1199810 [compost metagenome]
MRQFGGTVFGTDINGDLRQPHAGDGGDVINIRQLLNGIFQRQGDFFLHLLGRSAVITGDYHRSLDGKGRILQPADVEKRQHAANT